MEARRGDRRPPRDRRRRPVRGRMPRELVRGRRLRTSKRRTVAQRGRVGEGGTVRRAGARRRGVGVDGKRIRRLLGLSRTPLPRVLGGLLPGRLPRAAGRVVGHVAPRCDPHLPQLGPAPAPPDLRRPAPGTRGSLRTGPPRAAPRAPAPVLSARRVPVAWGRQDLPMEPLTPQPVAEAAIRIDSYLSGSGQRTLADDVLDGLTRPFKELPPKHFYDARGAELFDRICDLPEYYPTRAERAILTECAAQLAQLTDAAELVELGSGTAAKTRVLLDALHESGTLVRYVP